jgi:hypothetical protein
MIMGLKLRRERREEEEILAANCVADTQLQFSQS